MPATFKTLILGLLITGAFALGASQVRAQELRSLNSYLQENNLDDPAALLYLSLRCSAQYAHAASVTQDRPEINSKFESSTMELVMFAHRLKSKIAKIGLEKSMELNMQQFDMMFTAIKSKAEKNWALTGSYGDDMYWADIEVCGAFYEVVMS